MNNKKRNTIITVVILVFILLSGFIYFLLNFSSKENSLTVIEKKWLTDNANKMVDIDIYNDIPVYGYNGKGIIFEYLDYLSKQFNINFNKISYYNELEKESDISFRVLNSNEKVLDKDIVLDKDHYVILSLDIKDNFDLTKLNRVGILNSDSDVLKKYFNEEIGMVVYDDTAKLIDALIKKEVNYLVLPNLCYMDEILKNKLNVVYHLNDLEKTIVLRTKNETIYNILKKNYLDYLSTEYEEDYSKNYLDIYFTSTATSDLNKKNYNAKAYKYGYVINMPYENYINQNFVGTISNYLKDFEKIADLEIEVMNYANIDELKSALVSGEIDFALTNFDYKTINLENVTTSSIKELEYIVLSKNEYIVNSIKGLKDEELFVVGSSILEKIAESNGIKTKKFANTDDLLRNVDDYSIVLLDKETYEYYKDDKLKDYKIILEDNANNDEGYRFILNSKNETFNLLFSYYVSMIDYKSIRYDYHTNVNLDKDYTMIKIIIFIVALILFLLSTVILMNRKNVTNTVISKEEVLKYIDPMTSLKNRNYLNMNIYKWDDNVIFPQSVVVLDVNRLRLVNDTFGRETGDEIIKKVASILINNQLENTDIIRSGGDEFLIYMIGYEEKAVVEYTKKLMREAKEISNCSGVEVGYSMILDEVKTVDDAINEAITMMTKNKEKKKAKEEKELV